MNQKSHHSPRRIALRLLSYRVGTIFRSNFGATEPVPEKKYVVAISKPAPTSLHTIFQGHLDWEEKVHTTTLISKFTADTPGMTVSLTGKLANYTRIH